MRFSIVLICLLVALGVYVSYRSITIKTQDHAHPSIDLSMKTESETGAAKGPTGLHPSENNASAINAIAEHQKQLQGHISSQLLSKGARLSAEQKYKLASAISIVEDMQSSIESKHLSITSRTSDTLKMQISPYREEGLALRKAFLSQVAVEMPGDAAKVVREYLMDYIDIHFKGFGTMAQEISIYKTKDAGVYNYGFYASKPNAQDNDRNITPSLNCGTDFSAYYKISQEELKLPGMKHLYPIIQDTFEIAH